MAVIDKLNINGTSYDINDARNIFNLVYPVGSIYMSVNSTSPSTLFGGTWEQLPAGYALWTANSDAGSTIAAGLPNIIGTFRYASGIGAFNRDNAHTGAFGWEAVTSGVTNSITGTANSEVLGNHTFNASQSNSIYGKSTTVQPPAIKLYVWKRTT